MPFKFLNYRGINSKYYFFDSIWLPANPTNPMPNKIRVVGFGMETVFQSTSSSANCDNAEALIANERRKTVRATISRFFSKFHL